MKQYIWNLLISLDQFINTIIGGHPDETLSSRCWHHREDWRAALAVKFIDWLFSPFEFEHCKNAYEIQLHPPKESK